MGPESISHYDEIFQGVTFESEVRSMNYFFHQKKRFLLYYNVYISVSLVSRILFWFYMLHLANSVFNRSAGLGKLIDES